MPLAPTTFTPRLPACSARLPRRPPARSLLLVRLCLLVAYAFLLAAGSLGLPLWPALSNPGYISLDLICW